VCVCVFMNVCACVCAIVRMCASASVFVSGPGMCALW